MGGWVESAEIFSSAVPFRGLMKHRECRLAKPRAPTVSTQSGECRGGRSPFCQVIEGVPQIYQVKGGWVGKER